MLSIFIVISILLALFLWGRLVNKKYELDSFDYGCLYVFAAHQDDEIITGGELIIEAIKKDASVDIVFLTCGDEKLGSDKSEVRKKEAIEVANSLGLIKSNVKFLDYLQSNVSGPSYFKEDSLKQAFSDIEEVILKAKENACLLIPAYGESHSDHRVLRELVLSAVTKTQRQDLVIFESPAYNNNLSLVNNPRRVFWVLGGSIPVLGKYFKRFFSISPRAMFVGGSKSGIFLWKFDEQRLLLKRKLLGLYLSENGELLKRLFGNVDIYRKIENAKKALEYQPFSLSFDDYSFSVSGVIAFSAFYFLLAFFVQKFNCLTGVFELSYGAWLYYIATVVSVGLAFKTKSYLRKLFWLSIFTGVALSAPGIELLRMC